MSKTVVLNKKSMHSMFYLNILEKIKNIKIDNVLILKSIPKIQLKLDKIIIHYDLAIL